MARCPTIVTMPLTPRGALRLSQVKIGDGSVQTLCVKASDRCKDAAERFITENSLKAWQSASFGFALRCSDRPAFRSLADWTDVAKEIVARCRTRLCAPWPCSFLTEFEEAFDRLPQDAWHKLCLKVAHDRKHQIYACWRQILSQGKLRKMQTLFQYTLKSIYQTWDRQGARPRA